VHPTGRWHAVVALSLYAVIWFGMWGPFYIARSGLGLVLWPIAVVLLMPVAVLAAVGVVKGVSALSQLPRGDPNRRSALQALIISVPLLLLGLPALWFGNIPYLLVTGTTGLMSP
jgi:hypothetical protein